MENNRGKSFREAQLARISGDREDWETATTSTKMGRIRKRRLDIREPGAYIIRSDRSPLGFVMVFSLLISAEVWPLNRASFIRSVSVARCREPFWASAGARDG